MQFYILWGTLFKIKNTILMATGSKVGIYQNAQCASDLPLNLVSKIFPLCKNRAFWHSHISCMGQIWRICVLFVRWSHPPSGLTQSKTRRPPMHAGPVSLAETDIQGAALILSPYCSKGETIWVPRPVLVISLYL